MVVIVLSIKGKRCRKFIGFCESILYHYVFRTSAFHIRTTKIWKILVQWTSWMERKFFALYGYGGIGMTWRWYGVVWYVIDTLYAIVMVWYMYNMVLVRCGMVWYGVVWYMVWVMVLEWYGVTVTWYRYAIVMVWYMYNLVLVTWLYGYHVWQWYSMIWCW